MIRFPKSSKKQEEAVERHVRIKFDGQLHQVDLGSYMGLLMAYSSVIDAAAEEVGLPCGLQVNVTANEPGSLDVVLSLAASAANGTLDFMKDNLVGIQSAIVVAGGLFELKRSLAGSRKVESIEDAGDGKVYVKADTVAVYADKHVSQIFVNKPKVTQQVSDAFDALSETPSVTALQISTDDEVIFRAESSEFYAISTSPDYDGEESRHVERRAWLTVVKPLLVPSSKRKWEFLYAGQKITAPIADREFLSDLGSVTFKVGMCLDVVLDVLQKYDADSAAYLDKGYTIRKVLRYEFGQEQEALFNIEGIAGSGPSLAEEDV